MTAIPVCPMGEQKIIVEEIEKRTTRIDQLHAQIDFGISHLHELRTALISAAVTGKIDVRENSA